jgi:NAD+ synthase (glutamine-hydrolysing)
MLEFDWFIDACENAVQTIASHCIGIAAIVGAPLRNAQPKGKKLFNAAFWLQDGAVKQVIHKSLLPTYDVFDEYRYFEPGEQPAIVDYKGLKIALTICEDLWSIGKNPLYADCPMDVLTKQHPDLMINIAASPFSQSHQQERKEVLKQNVSKYQIPLIYCNQIGAHTELLFDGASLVMNKQGDIIEQCVSFEETLDVFHAAILGSRMTTYLDEVVVIEQVYKALVMGIRDYFAKSGFSKAILGLSGGLDSAVVASLAVAALGKDNVLGVLLPSQYSSDHSVTDAEILGTNLGITIETIAIADVFESFEQALQPQFNNTPFGLAEENLQARIRGAILMAMSNKFGHILLNTTNKSELAVGYGTLYGDMCGGISVLGDVYKTQVYQLAHYINRKEIIIPVNTITKAPSAELRPDQKDSDSLPEYDVLDAILYQYIELRQSKKHILSQGFDALTVEKVLKLVNMNEYKRYQAAPVLRVSSKAFRSGRRMPLVAKYEA